jgi:hypothetical protein
MERAMRKSVPAADPDAYVRALTGWRRTCVDTLALSARLPTIFVGSWVG